MPLVKFEQSGHRNAMAGNEGIEGGHQRVAWKGALSPGAAYGDGRADNRIYCHVRSEKRDD